MLEQLQTLGFGGYGNTAHCDISDTHSSESPQKGRASTPNFSPIGTGLESSGSTADPLTSHGDPSQEYGTLGTPLKNGTDLHNTTAEDISCRDDPHRGPGYGAASVSNDPRFAQTLPRAAKKVSPPLVPGAAPWNDSVWDNYWLHKPETMYGREFDRTSVMTVSPKASVDDDGSYDNHDRSHTAQALSDELRNTSEKEIRRHGLNPRELPTQVSRQRAMRDGFTGMTDLITRSALNRRARQNWVERRGGLAHYAKLMGDDP